MRLGAVSVPGAEPSCYVAAVHLPRQRLETVRWLAGALATVMLAGCPADEEPPNLVSKRIGPEGGVVSSHDDVLQIVILGGALTKAVDIEIYPSDEPPPIFGPAYRVRPDIPLEIDAEVTYRRVLPQDPNDVAVAAIHREDFENGAGAWVPLPRFSLDVENRSVTGLDSELSLFYGMLEDAYGGLTTTGTDSVGDDSTGTTGGTDTGGSDETGFGPLSHAVDIQPIWNEACVADCHESGGLNQDVLLNGGEAYDELLMGFPVAATIPYVEAGDPDRSYLLHKLDGTQDEVPGGGGSPMPLGKPLLPAQTREKIRAWIAQGAPE